MVSPECARHNRTPPVLVTEEMMAALHAQNAETAFASAAMSSAPVTREVRFMPQW